MVGEAQSSKKKWHISREVPLSLVYLFVAQLVGLAWLGVSYGQGMQSSVADHEKRLVIIENQKMAERIISLEQQMVDAKRLMEKIDGKVDILLTKAHEHSKK